MNFWLTQYWPPRVDEDDRYSRVFIPADHRASTLELAPGDEVFIYETKSGPKRAVHADGIEVPVQRRPGRQGVVAVARVTGMVNEEAEDETLYDGKRYDFRYWAPTELIDEAGFATPAALRRVLGWEPTAPLRNLAFRSLTPTQATALRASMGLVASVTKRAPVRKPGQEPDLDDIAAAEEKKGAFDPQSAAEARERTLRSIALRFGQPEFRKKLLQVYGGRCAISDCDLPEALEACHIAAYAGKDTNRVTNGLLLRGDLHSLFDRGLIGVDPRDHKVRVHSRLRGTVYEAFDGKSLRLPTDPRLHPSGDALGEQLRRLRHDVG
jgi:hypothetical protein